MNCVCPEQQPLSSFRYLVFLQSLGSGGLLVGGRHNYSLEGYIKVYQVKKAGKERKYNREYKIIVFIILCNNNMTS